ncbi:hypothetical protein ACVWZZ_007020 [Bradyrhizobium sp. LM6.10]
MKQESACNSEADLCGSFGVSFFTHSEFDQREGALHFVKCVRTTSPVSGLSQTA